MDEQLLHGHNAIDVLCVALRSNGHVASGSRSGCISGPISLSTTAFQVKVWVQIYGFLGLEVDRGLVDV